MISFEDWTAEPDEFDLVISATAFHWIPPELGYPKAARVLKDSGALAIFGNEHPAQPEAFFTEVQEIYQKVVPEWGPPLTNQIIEARVEAKIASTVAAINTTKLFEPVTVNTYAWSQDYTTTTYIRLLNTYSDHRNLEEHKRTQLFQEIAALIEKEYGGVVTKHYLSILNFAKNTRCNDLKRNRVKSGMIAGNISPAPSMDAPSTAIGLDGEEIETVCELKGLPLRRTYG